MVRVAKRTLVLLAGVSWTLFLSAAVVRECVRVDGSTDRAAPPGKTLRANLFADDALWNVPENYDGRLKVTRSGGALTVEGTATNRLDTAWGISTKPFPLSVRGLGYALSFRLETSLAIKLSVGDETYGCAVVWYDHDGKRIERDPFLLRANAGTCVRKLYVGSVPLAAESCSLQLGFDRPNVLAGQRIRLSELSFSVMEAETDPAWTPLVSHVDEIAPRVRVVSETPFTNPKADLRIAIESRRTIDWSKTRFRIDGQDATSRFVRDGNVFTCRIEGQWERGLHEIDVSFLDPETGEMKTAHKTVLCGEPPKTDWVELREDGIALVGGEPFFPIGVFSVCEREFNGHSLDRAMEDLKRAGVNTVHAYSGGRGEKFLSAADRHGLKVWAGVHKADAAFVEMTRHHPSVLAWYVGDDTSMHDEPFDVFDRSDSVRSADPNRITAQADVMNSGDVVSSYRAFVKTTDVFMPEIYPCHDANRVPEPRCVALAIRDMKRYRSDVAEAKDGRPHAIWPIIQYFDGWNAWHRFPTRDELFAMSFAVLAHGANGITWYTYGGFTDPKRNMVNRGVTATPEIWKNFTELTSRIATLTPVLTAPVPMQPKPPKVLSGPARDELANDSISVSLRRAGRDAYLIAVNSTCEKVTAELDLLDGTISSAEVLWESRHVKVDGARLREAFEPFAVHVYHWRAPAAEERVNLWPAGKTPDAQTTQKGAPYVEFDEPEKVTTDAIAIIAPGGCYNGWADAIEGAPLREYLLRRGMRTATLRYRVPRPEPPLPKHLTAWQDAQRAVRIVRSQAAARGYSPDKIGFIGFSAGGHLSLMAATSSLTPAYDPVDALDRLSCSVNWAAPVYPAYVLKDGAESANRNGGNDLVADTLVPEFRLDTATPPMCIFHGDADTHAAMGSVRMYHALRLRRIPAELHIFANEGHVFFRDAPPGTPAARWKDRLWEWLGKMGFAPVE